MSVTHSENKQKAGLEKETHATARTRMISIIIKAVWSLNSVAAVALTFMMVLTVVDVILRYFSHPILGSYEIVALCGGIVVGFAIPSTSLEKGHVFMDFVTTRISTMKQRFISILTRVLVAILFVLIGVSLFRIGAEFRTSGEVSATLQLPIYPVLYGVAISCFLVCFVFLLEIVGAIRGDHG